MSATTQPIDAAAQFDVLTTLLTALAFIGVFLTVYLQDLQIREQRAETDKRDKEAGEERKLAAHQRVRSDTFQLLDAWQEIVHNTKYLDTDGRKAFSALKEACRDARIPRGPGGGFQIRYDPLDRDGVSAFYDGFYRGEISAALGNYFRLLYHIVKYINASKLTAADKDNLVSVIRAHISESEHYLLFWNGVTHHGKKMFPFIEQYSLLHNFNWQGNGIQVAEFRNFYPQNYQRWLAEEAPQVAPPPPA